MHEPVVLDFLHPYLYFVRWEQGPLRPCYGRIADYDFSEEVTATVPRYQNYAQDIYPVVRDDWDGGRVYRLW